MSHGMLRWAKLALAVVVFLGGAMYLYAGLFGIATSFSLKRSPPPPELHVMSANAVLTFGVLHATLGTTALVSAVILAFTRNAGAWGCAVATTGLTVSALYNNLALEAPAPMDFAVPIVLGCAAFGAWATLYGAGRRRRSPTRS